MRCLFQLRKISEVFAAAGRRSGPIYAGDDFGRLFSGKKMRFNRLMHSRNRYKHKPPDFMSLAKKYPTLRQLCSITTTGKINVNFKDDRVVRVISELLLREDFKLNVRIPEGYLVPRVAQRLNYILTLEDILKLNAVNESVIGVDIVSQNPNWRMYATDIDREACVMAEKNVRNNFDVDKIVVLQTDADHFFKKVLDQEKEITFSMCNPPFFNDDELSSKFHSVSSAPASDKTYTNASTDDSDVKATHSRTVAQRNELNVDGGEAAFIRRMIDESQTYKTHVRIYTTLLGKKASLEPLKMHLRAVGVERHQDWIIGQGQTCRWILAWTWAKDVLFD